MRVFTLLRSGGIPPRVRLAAGTRTPARGKCLRGLSEAKDHKPCSPGGIFGGILVFLEINLFIMNYLHNDSSPSLRPDVRVPLNHLETHPPEQRLEGLVRRATSGHAGSGAVPETVPAAFDRAITDCEDRVLIP